MTVAELGLKIETAPATAAARELDKLSAAGHRATAEFDRLQKVAQIATSQFNAINSVARRNNETFALAAARFADAGNKFSAGAKAANDNIKQLAAAGPAIGGIAGSLAAMVSPATLAGFALSAAGTAVGVLIAKWMDTGPSVEATMKEHARLVGVVKDSYDKAANAARDWFEQSKAVTELQIRVNEVQLREQLNRATGLGLQRTLQKDFASFFGFGDPEIAAAFKPFSDAIYTLNEQLQEGAPNVRQFVDEVARIALESKDPALQKIAADLVKVLDPATEAAKSLEQVAAMMRAINGIAPSRNDRKILGLPEPRQIRETKDAYDRMVETVEKRNERLAIEIQTLGMSAGAAAAYRVEQELLNAAQRANIDLTPEMIANNQRLAETAAMLATKTEAMRKAQELVNQFSDAGRSAVSGYVSDLANGVSHVDAMANALKRLSDRLLDMAVNQLWDAAFPKTGGGGLFGSLFGMGGGGAPAIGMVGAAGGMAVPTFFHGGGLVGRDGVQRGAYRVPDRVARLHTGADLRSDEVFAVLQRGETVIPKGGHRGGVVVNNYGRPDDVSVSERDDGTTEITFRGLVRDEIASPRSNGVMRKKTGSRGPLIQR